MPLDPRAKRFLDTLAAMNPPSALSLTVAARREALAHLLGFSGAAESVAALEERTLPGPAGPLTLRCYTPREASQTQRLPGLIYLHGGGLVAGTLDTHDPIARALANASGCRILALGYRLGPEHPFPAALEDACAASEWIGAHAAALNLDAGRLGIAGDSAGATLAAVVAQWSVASARVRFAFQFLLCPIMDFVSESDSRRSLAEGYLVDRATLQHDLKHYLAGGADAADPRVSPLRAAELAGLPAALVHTAEFDPLRDEGREYAVRLEAAGVRTLYRCHPGMIHLFYGMGGLIPYAGAAYQLMGEDIRGLLAASKAL